MSVTAVRLRPEVGKNLKAMADESRRSKSWLINEALRQYIANRKTQQDRWEQTLQAMEPVAQGKVVPGEIVYCQIRTT